MNWNQHKLKKWAGDIRFWILLFFLIRLYGITDAPLETGHNWRQTFTNMIARNFLEEGPDFLHPKVDFGGENSGIVGSEFPLYQYIIFLFHKIFGFAHWYGRFISLVFSSLGCWYFFRLVRDWLGKSLAFKATFVLLFSIWFSFSRKSMPDVFSASLVIMGLWYGWHYLKSNKIFPLILYLSLCLLGLISKLPSLSIFAIAFIMPFFTGSQLKTKIVFWSISLIPVIATSLWHFIWVPHLTEQHHLELFWPRSIGTGIRELAFYKTALFQKFYFAAFHSYIAFSFFIIGLFYFIRDKKGAGVWTILFVFAVFLGFMAKTGYVFAVHNYYIIPFVPWMAILVGYGLEKLPLKVGLIVLSLLCMEGMLNQVHDFNYAKKEAYKLKLESELDGLVPQKSKIIVNGGKNPQLIYFTHRKGWTVSNEKLMDTVEVNRMKALGAEYVLVDKNRFENDLSNLGVAGNVLLDNENFFLLKIKQDGSR